MKRVLLLLFILVAGVGCASAGQSSDVTPIVPVFPSADQVACEYEVLQIVRATWTTRAGQTTGLLMDRERSRLLGLAGGEVGADGVILLIPRGPGRMVAVKMGEPFTSKWEGEAIKCIRVP